MNDRELKRILETYTVRANGDAKKSAAEAAAAVKKRFVPMRITEFILNQLHYIRPPYLFLCLAFVVFVPLVAAVADKRQFVLFISFALPLLSAAAVPKITSRLHSGMLELENSLLYRTNTVFSARMMIYGMINTVCILVSSLFASLITGSFLWIFLFETMMLTLSSLVSLLLSYFIRNAYAPYASLAAVFVCAFPWHFARRSEYVEYLEFTFEGYISSLSLCEATAVLLVLLALLSVYFYKHYDFNGEMSYGN